MGAELSPDYHQRNKVTGTRAAFGLAGTIAALLITAITGQAGSDALTNALFCTPGTIVVQIYPYGIFIIHWIHSLNKWVLWLLIGFVASFPCTTFSRR